MNVWICSNCGKKVVSLLKTCPKCKTLRSPSDILQAPDRSERTADGKMKPTTIAAWVLFSIAMILAGFICYTFITIGVAPSHQNSEPQPSVPIQGYVSCSDKINTISTYAVYIGRAVACGQDIGRPMEYVGAWIDECFEPSERSSQLVIFEAGTRMNAVNQKNGNSPDSCEQVIKSFKKVTWPGKSAVTDQSDRETSKEPASYLSEAEKALPKVERVPLPFAAVTTIPVIDKTKLK